LGKDQRQRKEKPCNKAVTVKNPLEKEGRETFDVYKLEKRPTGSLDGPTEGRI